MIRDHVLKIANARVGEEMEANRLMKSDAAVTGVPAQLPQKDIVAMLVTTKMGMPLIVGNVGVSYYEQFSIL